MKPTCQTCFHWRRNTSTFRNLDYGKCHCPKLFNGHRVKTLDYPLNGLAVWQGVGTYAVLETGFAFGCLHHKPIDKGVIK